MTVTVTLLLTALVIGVAYRRVIFQEGNPLPMVWAAVRLAATDARVVPVTADMTTLLQPAGDERPLSAFLAERGWRFKDRLGGGIFYEKAGQTLFVRSRMLTRHYVVYQLQAAP